MLFQILSRNNDTSGNPYRLGLVYNAEGDVVEAYEERSSSPNFALALRKRGIKQLPSFHLRPSEYNSTKKVFESILERT